MDSDESVKDDESAKDVWVNPTYESSASIVSVEEYIAPQAIPSPKMKLFKQGLYSPGSGEICAKYIAASDSTVLKHLYYNYPSIKDPGIEKALQFPEEFKEFPDDGQELYLHLCKEMNLIPVRIFHRGLLTKEIILRYYGVNPVGIRAMCMALARNRTVKRLDLTSNYLDHRDACYHIGQMLGDRNALTELVLSGCNIGSKFLRLVLNLLKNRTLDMLDLSENKIRDEGFPFLSEQIMHGAVIKRLKLRRNDLTSYSLSLLAEVIEFHDHTTHLDISWNMFYKTKGVIQLIRVLRHSKVLVELNLSYTSLSVGAEIGALLRIKTLKVLDVSHNRLTTLAARTIARNLIWAKSLQVLDVSCNPFSPPDALALLLSLNEKKIKLKELRMDSIVVNKEFAEQLKEIRNLTFRQNTVITYDYVLGNYTLPTKDIKAIYLKQLVNLTKKKKKGAGFDILLYLLDLHKTQEILEINQFMDTMKGAGAPVDDEFVTGLSKCFPGPKTQEKIRPLSLELLVDYIHRIYPDKEPSPTPVSKQLLVSEQPAEVKKDVKKKGKTGGKAKGK